MSDETPKRNSVDRSKAVRALQNRLNMPKVVAEAYIRDWSDEEVQQACEAYDNCSPMRAVIDSIADKRRA